MKPLWLILATAAAVAADVLLIQQFSSKDLALLGSLAADFLSPAASGITSNMPMTSFVSWEFIFCQRSRGKGPGLAIFIEQNLLIGLACALPKCLTAREGREAVALWSLPAERSNTVSEVMR